MKTSAGSGMLGRIETLSRKQGAAFNINDKFQCKSMSGLLIEVNNGSTNQHFITVYE